MLATSRDPDKPAVGVEGRSTAKAAIPLLALSLALALAAACGDEDDSFDGSGPPARHDARLELVAEGLDFPVYLTQLPGGPLFVVEKTGTVRRLTATGPEPTPFLDLTGQVSGGGEQGLLSMTFHPQVVANRRFFVSYTDRQGDSQVVEYALALNDGDPPQRIGTILSVDQPFANHNGGHIVFGPDGMFYFGLGDGGGAGDPNENAQDLGSLLGKLLRLDLERSAPYGIPASNPFADSTGARPEIWAYGLRNPWRFAFDRETGDLYIADVGQNEREEVDVTAAGSAGGENYGWDLLEGTRCFEPRTNCERPGLVAPVVEYDHDVGCSITGGYVYRGTAVPAIAGHYFYADYCSGFVRSFRWIGGVTEEATWPELSPPAGRVTSFGEDESGELYVLSNHGEVYRVVAAQ
jgi:glucose/arabinose dehydrogenase